MKEERGNLGAWKCKECLAALQVCWVSHKTCQVWSCYCSNSFYPFGSLPALVLCFYDRNISHMFLIKNNRCSKVKDMQNTVQLCCTETEMWFVGSLSVFLSSHQRISWNWRSRQVSLYLSNLTVTLLPCKRPLFSFCLLEWGGERDALPEPRQAFDVAKFRTSWLVNLVFSCQTGFPSSIIGLLN